MDERYVIATFASISRANIALNVIHSAGFTGKNVSFITRSDSDELKNLQQMEDEAGVLRQIKLSQHSTASAPILATTGAAIGGIIVAPFAIGTMLLPLIIVGPLVGAGAGALVGSLLNGDSSTHSEQVANVKYADTIHQGGALIVVHAMNHVEMQRAWDALKTCDPIALSEWESERQESVQYPGDE